MFDFPEECDSNRRKQLLSSRFRNDAPVRKENNKSNIILRIEVGEILHVEYLHYYKTTYYFSHTIPICYPNIQMNCPSEPFHG